MCALGIFVFLCSTSVYSGFIPLAQADDRQLMKVLERPGVLKAPDGTSAVLANQ